VTNLEQTAAGKFADAIPLYEKALKELRLLKDDFVWHSFITQLVVCTQRRLTTLARSIGIKFQYTLMTVSIFDEINIAGLKRHI